MIKCQYVVFFTTFSTYFLSIFPLFVIGKRTLVDLNFDLYHCLPGLYNGLPSEAENIGYIVTFKVENKAGKHLDVIGVKVIFCDANNNELCFKLTSVYDVPNSYVKESWVTLYESDTSYFYNIEKVRFEIIID